MAEDEVVTVAVPVKEQDSNYCIVFLKFLGFYWKGIVLILCPCVAALVFLLGTEPKFRCLYLVIIMAVYWVTECIPLQITGLLPIVLIPVLGIQSTDKVCLNYFNQTNMVFMASILIATGIEHCGLHKRIAYSTILFVGCSPRRLHFGLTMVTSFLSMWLTNAATCAMMCPVILAVLQELESEGIGSVYKPKLPTDAEEDRPKPTNITIAYFLTAAFASTIGGIGSIVGTPTNLTYKGLYEVRFPEGNKIEFVPWLLFNVPPMLLMCFVLWMSLEFIYMGLFRPNSEESQIIKEGAVHKSAAEKVIKVRMDEMGGLNWCETGVLLLFCTCVGLWFFRKPQFITGWGDLYSIAIGDATPAIFVICMFAAMPSSLHFLKYCQLPKSKRPFKMTSPLVPWKVLQQKMPWGLLFLLGGGFALADAGKVSGMSLYLGEKMSGMANLPPFAVLCLTNLFATMATELTSNTAICNIISPVLIEMACAMKVHPIKFTYTAAIECSFAFLLPVGTPANAIVVDLGNVSTANMVKGGIIIKIFAWVIYMILFPTYGRLFFDHDKFPDWAKPANTTAARTTAAILNATTVASTQ